jgi:putative transposase
VGADRTAAAAREARRQAAQYNLREVMNAILYLATSGCQSRILPREFPLLLAVQRYFYAWHGSGLWQMINHLLVMAARQIEGRKASPSAG